MTNYTNCLTLEQMEYLDLFDNIPYKVVKKLVKMDDDTDFEVEIKEIEIDDYNKCSTSFKFTIKIDISQGWLPLMVDKEYCIIKEYDSSSPMAMFIGENLAYPTDEESEEEEEKGCMKCGSAPRHNQTDENGSYLCLSCEDEDEFECELCKKIVNETEYLPSKDDAPSILGNDYCLDCFKNIEQFKYVEDIPEDLINYDEVATCCEKCKGEGCVLVSYKRVKELSGEPDTLCPFVKFDNFFGSSHGEAPFKCSHE